MQRVMQDRGVGVAGEGDVGAQAGLQAEIAEGGGASDEGIEEAVAVTLQLDAAGFQLVDRNFVAQHRCQQRFAPRVGANGVLTPQAMLEKPSSSSSRSETRRIGNRFVNKCRIVGS